MNCTKVRAFKSREERLFGSVSGHATSRDLAYLTALLSDAANIVGSSCFPSAQGTISNWPIMEWAAWSMK